LPNYAEKTNDICIINSKKKKTNKMIIDIDKLFSKMLRKRDASMYFNDNCFIILNGTDIKNIPILILYLYDNKYYNRNGIMIGELQKGCPLNHTTVRYYCFLFCPFLINIQSSRKDMNSYQARYISLTDAGVEFALRIKEKIEANKNE